MPGFNRPNQVEGANLAVKEANLFAKELRVKMAEFDPQSPAYKDLSQTNRKNKLIEAFLSDAEIEINRRSKPFITGSEAVCMITIIFIYSTKLIFVLARFRDPRGFTKKDSFPELSATAH